MSTGPSYQDSAAFELNYRDLRSINHAYRRLPLINGYPEIFSVFSGETIAIRAAHKLASKPIGNGGERANPRFVKSVDILDAVTGRRIHTYKPAVPTQIFEQAPASYKGDGAGYGCRISLDTTGWPAAVYECVIHDSAGDNSQEIYFNIKPRSFDGFDLACVLPTFTWHAYNWVGGGSFYSEGLGRLLTITSQRPITRKRDNFIESALPFLTAFASAGVRYACIDSWDLHHQLGPSGDIPVMALLTHDEYWSDSMRKAVNRFLRRAGGLLVFAGNVCWWKVSVRGNEITVDKTSKATGGLWSNHGKPEETTFLSSFRFGGYPVETAQRSPQRAPYVAHLSASEAYDSGGVKIVMPGHPIFDGIRLPPDNCFGADVPIMYREIDGIPLNDDGTVNRKQYKADKVAPRIIATGLALHGALLRRVGVVVEASVRGGHVLHMGTFGWSLGLMQKNVAVKQIIINAYSYVRGLSGRHLDETLTGV